MVFGENLKNHARFTRDFILDLIFPLECLNCGLEGAWLCPDCFKSLPLNHPQYCVSCKKPERFGKFCSACAPLHFLDGIWIAGSYDNRIISALIKNLKYHFAQELADTLGHFLCLFLDNFLAQSRVNHEFLNRSFGPSDLKKIKEVPEIILRFKETILAPVPLSSKRERWRGFNQSLAIARILSDFFHLPILTGLKRIKHKTPQAKLKEKDRYLNIKDSFAWQGGDLKEQRLILIDDVVTTGATLDECAKILKQAGAKEVWAVVAAKG